MSWEDLQEVLLSSWNWPEHSPPHPLPILCGSLLCAFLKPRGGPEDPKVAFQSFSAPEAWLCL